MRLAILTIFLLTLAISGCGDRMALPSVQRSDNDFGANDTTYIRIGQDWTAPSIGYNAPNPMEPVDIVIGEDNYLFVADLANDRIITLTQNGQVARDLNLDKIYPVAHPLAIDIDAKLNLLIVNGSNTIYVWNQYVNMYGMLSAAVDTNDQGDPDFITDKTLIDSLKSVHPFYVDDDPTASFQGIAFAPLEDNAVYVTDSQNNRIIRLNLVVTAAARMTSGHVALPMFSGIFAEEIASYGSGAGTVDNPRSITCDQSGNIYFTQLGGNFLVQKLKKQGSSFIPGYTLYEDPIMDLNRFMGPNDIALGQDDAIFVVDTPDSGRVSKFVNKGTRAGKSTNLGKTGLALARFNRPMGIAVSDDEMVYIANSAEHRIERFQYSISDSDIPIEPQ